MKATAAPRHTLRILHLEDEIIDRRMIQATFAEQSVPVEFIDVEDEKAFAQALQDESFDLVLSDKSLPGFDGLTALRLVRAARPHVPFIFVSGSMGEESAIETMREGATDYILKSRLLRLVPAVERAVRESEDRTRSRQIEARNREQAALLDVSQDAIFMIDVRDKILFCNKMAEKMYHWPRETVVGREVIDILPTPPLKYVEAKTAVLEKGSWTGEVAASCEGRKFILESRWTLVRDESGNPKHILITDTDITERKATEAKFMRAQRMESIGALAGGIAHDLNNALAPVIMSSELLKGDGVDPEHAKFLDIIHSNAQRATSLVKQILGFARGGDHGRGPVQLGSLIDEMRKMVGETFPKSIEVNVKMDRKNLWDVQADITEIHQVLLNLCVNARDAMPGGGTLAISVENCTVGENNEARRAPGSYVRISVADTGTGIPADVLPRIFEPFFTTKEGDKGTGLGLATVSEIIKHHGGILEVQTQPGKGTQFVAYIPAIQSRTPTGEPAKKLDLPTGHGELILLIDDEETLLELTKTMLESSGYRVITARNGIQGISQFREKKDEIRLVVTDTDMPKLDGIAAVRAIKELKADLPVIIASGSVDSPNRLAGLELNRLRNLGKPYSIDQLLVAIDMQIHN